jgi:SAM-dependent methyltransferase
MSSATTSTTYGLDPAWHAERDRLASLTALYDAGTLARCEQLGLGPGLRCLDVGAGTGSVAQALAERVGPGGSVVALDLDTRFLEPLAGGVLEVRRHDVTAGPLPGAPYDLIHARLVLEHLPARAEVLRAMVAALAPGGRLLVEDFDWATAFVVDPPSELHQRVVDAVLACFRSWSYDPWYARTLPRLLGEAGLEEVGAEGVSKHVRADPAAGVPQWELLVDQLAPAMLAAGTVSQADLDAFHALWHDGATSCFAPLMVSAWGARP